ncbi:MAG: hypothetical protein L3K13_01225 [Thermoplasmata archaeon]|nr:hypothetical protein [Thermoplasmata archaeon]
MSGRICVTRRWKRAQRSAATLPAVAAPATGLFQGTVYLADLEFTGAGGPWSLAPADLATVQAYLLRAASPVSAYARQYGAAAVTVGNPLPRRSVTVTGGSYADAQLQQWVDAMTQAASLGPNAAILVLNPPGVVNRDAKESGGIGVLGYHGRSSIPYSFVNLLGVGLTVDDAQDVYAEAVSHELAEMTVDPQADSSNPEVCDGCGTNCQGQAAFRSYFDVQGRYVGSSTSFPPSFPYSFFLSAVAKPAVASDCPAPASGCAYAPP